MLHEAAPCTCGLLYGTCGGGCSLMFAASAGDHRSHYYERCGGGGGEAGFGTGSYVGSVDCTLSLGTSSTRRAEAGAARAQAPSGALHWDAAPVSSCNNGSSQQEANAAGARRCANCGTTSTPLWRNGPRGPKSLCNACGIRYKKEERRAAAAAAAPAAMASDGGVEYAPSYGHARQQQQWGCYGPASFGMVGDAAGEVGGPCLPWGLGVMLSPSPAFGAVREVPSLFQYY
ncbi:hypothetical protein PAHAL_5G217500 [Panicum hallii]|uniref:GATA-type domain-containing protein n=1 Tax=Panicum hallii TaxID=206008 RepID=A0A2S3HTF7_9POAL|nr:GATA transcription factor 15-like [Panicum hallii]PAN29335.1 hypothetical protein PAHAL_5G217500 [Panicum hallii]